MKQYEADEKMVGLFGKMVDKAEAAEDNEELRLFTDNAHKLYITLTNSGAFEQGIPEAPKTDFSS